MLDELSIFITTVLNRGIKKFINKNAKVDFELTKLKNAKVLEYYLKLPKSYIDKEMYSIMYNNIILNDASVSIVNRYYTFPDGKKVLRYKIDKQIKIMNHMKECLEE